MLAAEVDQYDSAMDDRPPPPLTRVVLPVARAPVTGSMVWVVMVHAPVDPVKRKRPVG